MKGVMILLQRRGLSSYYNEGGYGPIIKKGVYDPIIKKGVMNLL
jgi:hypothetical protein